MIGLVVLIGVTWVLLWVSLRRNAVIHRKLDEPHLVHDELLRRLTDAYVAAKAMLAACPDSDLPAPCAQRRGYLSVAVAALEEFSEDDAPSENH